MLCTMRISVQVPRIYKYVHYTHLVNAVRLFIKSCNDFGPRPATICYLKLCEYTDGI